MPRGVSPKRELSEREKLQLKQRGDNLRRRQGIGSAKYAEFFFRHRSSYPFTRKTYPSLGGRVESSREEWDGIDPSTGQPADWLNVATTTPATTTTTTTTVTTSKEGCAERRADVLCKQPRKRKACAVPGNCCKRQQRCVSLEPPASESSGGSDQAGYGLVGMDPEERRRDLQRDLRVLMEALRQIPTPRRAALAIEGMLSKREVQYALEKFGTGSELGLTRKELAAITVLQNAVSYQ